MKLFLLLLFPFLVFAQSSLPDTLILIDGRTFPCLVTSMSDEKLDIIYDNDKSESVVLKAISSISIGSMGVVYLDEQGLTMESDQINVFVENRMQMIEEEELIQDELLKMSVISNANQSDLTISKQSLNVQKFFKMKKWSFGVLLIPYYTGTNYSVVHYIGSYPPQVITNSYSESELNMQGQLAYAVDSNIILTLDVTYSSTYGEVSSEYHRRNEFEEYDYGTKSTDGLYMFDFSLGVKYYFLKFFPNTVNIYAIAGIGKQFASAEANDEDLYPGPEPTPIIEDNIAEYLEGLNSPWHFDFGFGVEYLFNESLSLNSNIRFIYASVSSEYDYRFISEYETITESIDYSNSEFMTRIGLGINFYF